MRRSSTPSSDQGAAPPRSERELRRFAFVVATGLAVIGVVSWWRDHTIAPRVLWGLAATLALAGLLVPRALEPVERWWLRVGLVLAWINTRIILTVLFFLVVTPIALVMRLFHDPLDRRLVTGAASYWRRRSGPPSDYTRQF